MEHLKSNPYNSSIDWHRPFFYQYVTDTGIKNKAEIEKGKIVQKHLLALLKRIKTEKKFPHVNLMCQIHELRC